MLVLKRRTPLGSQHGVIPTSLLPEGGVLDPSSTFLQRLWKASRANLAWLALALLLLPFGIYKLRDRTLP